MVFSYQSFFFSELREIIKPEIMDLIKQQRYNHMVEGAIFTKYAKANQKKGGSD